MKTSSCQQEPFSLAEDVSTRKTERIFEIEMIKFNGKAAHSLDKSLSAVSYTGKPNTPLLFLIFKELKSRRRCLQTAKKANA